MDTSTSETPIENNPETGIEADASQNPTGQNDEGQMDGTETGNIIKLDPEAYADKQDGDIVSTTVEGELIVHDGMKFLHAKTADGKPVQDFSPQDEENSETPDEENAEGMDDNALEGAIADYANKNTGLKGYMAK